MKIEDLLSGKSGTEELQIQGISVSVSALEKLIADGYVHLRAYEENQTFCVWGKNCTACFTDEQLREKA